MDGSNSQIMLKRTSQLVTAFVSQNKIPPAEIPMLIMAVYRALSAKSLAGPEPEIRKPPAVSLRRSITADHLICLEDGRKFKSLKRHLRHGHGMTPQGYIAKWGLAKDYPMVAPNYAAKRSDLAKTTGLGKGVRESSKPTSPRAKRSKTAV